MGICEQAFREAASSLRRQAGSSSTCLFKCRATTERCSRSSSHSALQPAVLRTRLLCRTGALSMWPSSPSSTLSSRRRRWRQPSRRRLLARAVRLLLSARLLTLLHVQLQLARLMRALEVVLRAARRSQLSPRTCSQCSRRRRCAPSRPPISRSATLSLQSGQGTAALCTFARSP